MASEWDRWVDFVSGVTVNDYFANSDAAHAATWNFQIGGHDGSVYAKTANFDGAFDQAEMVKLSNAANGDETDIFTAPPTGYTIIRLVSASSDFNVLTGKKKKESTRLIFASRTKSCFVVALVDVQNCDKGSESKAMGAFSEGITSAMDSDL